MPLTITAGMTAYVTTPQFMAYLNLPNGATVDTDELEMHLGAAQELVQSLIGPVLHRTVAQTLRQCGTTAVLNTWPALSLTSVTHQGATYTGTTLDASTGIIYDVRAPHGATATYVAGRDECPDAVILATLIIAAQTYRADQQGYRPDFGTPDEFGPTNVGFAVPRRAEALLAPYMPPPGVA